MWSWTMILASMFCSGQTAWFERKPENKNVFVGNTTLLYCCVRGNDIKWVQWTKNGFPLGFERTIPHFDGRYTMPTVVETGTVKHCTFADDTGSRTLRIENVALTDAGEYKCLVLEDTADHSTKSAGATLTVEVPDSNNAMVFTDQPQDTNLTMHGTAQLKCFVKNRVGQLQWDKSNFPIGACRTDTLPEVTPQREYKLTGCDQNETVLHILNATLGHEGYYKCQAGTFNNRIISRRAHVTLLVPCEPPQIIGSTPRNGASWIDVSHTDNSFEIVCEAYNRKSQPTFEWAFTFDGTKKNGILNNAETDTESVIHDSTKMLTKVKSTLKIKQQAGDNTNDFLRKNCIDHNKKCRFTCDPKGGCDPSVPGTGVYINMIVKLEDIFKNVGKGSANEELRNLIAATPEFKEHMQLLYSQTLNATLKNLMENHGVNLTKSDFTNAIEQSKTSGNDKNGDTATSTTEDTNSGQAIDGVKDIHLFYIALGVLGSGCLAGGVWQLRRYRKNKRALKQAGVPGAKVDVAIQTSQEDSKVPAASVVGAGGKIKAAVAPMEMTQRRTSKESGRSGMSYQSVGTDFSHSPTGSLVSGSDTASMISGTSSV